MGVLELLAPFYPINTAWMVFSSDLKMDPLNLYPTVRDFLHSDHILALKMLGVGTLITNPPPTSSANLRRRTFLDMWHLIWDM